jgi:hypothetical protein
MDLALAKHFKFFEDKLDAELRMDAFNVFNHVNFGNPNPPGCGVGACSPITNIDSPEFGQVTTTLGPRVVQIAMHIRF